MPAVWVGLLLALAASLFAGAALQFVSADFPQKMQELFEAIIGLAAVAILTWMVFWMRRVARAIKSELHQTIDTAFAGDGIGWALIGMAASVALGLAIFVGGLRIDLRRFFRWTGVFILIVAAGIQAGSLRNLHEAGLWNGLQSVVVDFSRELPVTSLIGTVLSGLFDYQEVPRLGEVLLYLGYLSITLILFFRPVRPFRDAAPNRTNSGAAANACIRLHQENGNPAGRHDETRGHRRCDPGRGRSRRILSGHATQSDERDSRRHAPGGGGGLGLRPE